MWPAGCETRSATVCAAVLALCAAAACWWAYRRRPRVDFTRKCAIVTGAASGIGAEIVECLVDARCKRIVLVDVNAVAVRRAYRRLLNTRSYYTQFWPEVCDVGDPAAVERVCDRIQRTCRDDEDIILVSNAGIVGAGDLDAMPDAQLQAVFNVNTLAAFRFIRHLLPRMKARGAGCIVLVSSMMGLLGSARLAAYCASKWALLGLAESLRLELQRDGFTDEQVPVVAACPYAASTPMFAGIFDDPRDRNPLRAALFPKLTPRHVAEAIVTAIHGWRSATIAVPPLLYWGAWAARALPLWAYDSLTGWFGGWHGMSSYQPVPVDDGPDSEADVVDASTMLAPPPPPVPPPAAGRGRSNHNNQRARSGSQRASGRPR